MLRSLVLCGALHYSIRSRLQTIVANEKRERAIAWFVMATSMVSIGSLSDKEFQLSKPGGDIGPADTKINDKRHIINK